MNDKEEINVKRGLIDADSIVWKIASACENYKYEYKGKIFDSKALASTYVNTVDGDINSITPCSFPEEEAEVERTTHEFLDNLISDLELFDYTIYLGTEGCFRYSLATRLPYKGNRGGSRPSHFNFVRSIIEGRYKVELPPPEFEADDMLSWNNREGDLLISIDKDMLQIPGYHYNFDTTVFKRVTTLGGIKSLACQILTGDSSDNILGLSGVGGKSKYLSNINECTDVYSIFSIIVDLYTQHYGTYAFQFLRENFMLLRLVKEVPSIEEKILMDLLNIPNKYWEV